MTWREDNTDTSIETNIDAWGARVVYAVSCVGLRFLSELMLEGMK